MKLLVVMLALTVADPPPIDCSLVRAKVTEHGKLAVYAWALANGYSRSEIARIRKVCGV